MTSLLTRGCQQGGGGRGAGGTAPGSAVGPRAGWGLHGEVLRRAAGGGSGSLSALRLS